MWGCLPPLLKLNGTCTTGTMTLLPETQGVTITTLADTKAALIQAEAVGVIPAAEAEGMAVAGEEAVEVVTRLCSG